LGKEFTKFSLVLVAGQLMGGFMLCGVLMLVLSMGFLLEFISVDHSWYKLGCLYHINHI
jgi:hypothetical protein